MSTRIHEGTDMSSGLRAVDDHRVAGGSAGVANHSVVSHEDWLEVTLAQLFEGRSQLIVYHFTFAPDWKAGCPICSFWADN